MERGCGASPAARCPPQRDVGAPGKDKAYRDAPGRSVAETLGKTRKETRR